MRADAERNRRLILHTADRMLAQRGAAVTLNEIAHEAGVGVATVYRRFPDLQVLIDTLFTERFTHFVQLATEAAWQPEPGRALCHYLLEAAQWRARDQALEVILAHASLKTEAVTRARDELGRLVDSMVERAVAAQAVRADFASADVYHFLYMVGAVADRTHGVSPDAWRRYAEILLTGFGLEPATDARTPAMTDAQLRRSWPTPAPPTD
nr:TetR/AcrR family transcriptional regulator [Streptomyces sp. SID14478]